MTTELISEAELAELLGMTPAQAAAKRREKGWPHVDLGRFNKRYTPEQVQLIINAHTVEAQRSSLAQSGRLLGQTARSARRSA